MLMEDQSNYSYNWDIYNSSFKPESSWDRIYHAFQYRSAAELNGYPVVGIYNSYWGGGYVYEMRGQKSYLQGNLTLLQKNKWIDRLTRAVIIEFSIFNPNINLIGVAEIVVEFLPTGTIIKSARFDPISLFSSLSQFSLVCDIIYLLFVVYYTIQEIRELYKQGKVYFLQFWAYIEWAIIIFSWIALGLYVYKIKVSSEVSQFFRETSGYAYYKTQNIVFWNLVLNYLFAVCIALGTLKCLKIFRFSKKISYLGSTLNNCAKELLGFCLMFFIVWISFAFLFNLYYEGKLLEFSTIIRSMTTCFDILLGKFHVDSLLVADSTFGPIFYFIFNVYVIFILITIFVSIINESFKVVREDSKKQDYHMINFLKNKLGIKDERLSHSNQEKNLTSTDKVYKDHLDFLPDKMDQLLNIINDVRCFYKKFLFKIITNLILCFRYMLSKRQ